MASAETLTEYERRRLENIRRNGEVMASLLLHRKASELSAFKTPKSKTPKSESDPGKLKESSESYSPVVIRRSLRTRGIRPSDLPPSPEPSSPSPESESPKRAKRAKRHILDSSNRPLLDAILRSSADPCPFPSLGSGGGHFDPVSSMDLKPKNEGKILSDRILSITLFPFADRSVVAAGNKVGRVGIWDADFCDGGDGVYVYSPHSAPVSGISIHPFTARKIYTSSYDGLISLMDIEKETSSVIYSRDDPIFSLCQWPLDSNSIYLGAGSGELKIWDERTGKVSGSWILHEHRINTIDFNAVNRNLMTTSSTDGRACIWDLRSIEKGTPKSIKTIQHARSVQSAFFSPSGSCLATTSIDNSVGILSGANFDDLSMIKHNNMTGRWLSSFRAIWGWDDSYLYMGNMKRAIDIISMDDKVTVALESPYMTAIPCRFAAHPFKEGTLACSTSTGKVYLWTKSS